MSNLSIFENNELGAKIRTITSEHGEPLFIAKDIADALGYTDSQAMTRRMDEDEKVSQSWTYDLSVQARMTSFVTESGLYSAIIGSQKPEAKAFKRWITHDVLPAIRKTGSYTAIADIQQEVDMIRSVSDALGIGDQGRLLASYYGKVPMSNGQKELAQDLIAKSDIAIKRSAMEIMQPRKDELILQLENKIVEKTTHTLTVSGIANQFPAKGVTSSKVIEALLYGKYIVPIKSNNSSSLYAPTNKGLEFCTPSAISIGVNKNIEVAKNWQYRDALKQDLESYLCIFV